MTSKFILILLILITNLFHLESTLPEKPSHISDISWELAEPHLLSNEERLKLKLDEIFKNCSDNPVLKKSHLERLGFYEFGLAHTSGIYVLKHKKLKGYVIKAYTDDHFEAHLAPQRYVVRCEGAKAALKAIAELNYEKYFFVPKKRLYVIPYPCIVSYILIAEEAPLLKRKENKRLWAKNVDRTFLEQFYEVIKKAGLADSVKIDNAAWGKNKKINFIDTEHYNEWPTPYERLLPHLRPSMQSAWIELNAN